MALNIEPEGCVQNWEVLFVDPFAVEICEDFRDGNTLLAKDITEMAVSMLSHGQRRPVECRRSSEGRLLLCHGHTRTLAARLIRTGFRYSDPEGKNEVIFKEKNFKLKVILVPQP